MREAVLIVPCFNESARLREAEFLALARDARLSLLFVDDGSTDRTAERLEALVGQSDGRAMLCRLARNSGKAEAVRQGLLCAIGEGATIVGYTDADLSTPAGELARLVNEIRSRPVQVLMGSRVRLLGSEITRRPVRHYLGRIFATGASLALGLAAYDTQCGAKLFRVTPILRAALERPFTSRWAFDVELLGRLLPRDGRPGYAAEDFVEVPLLRWSDVKGSKLDAFAAARAGLDLVRIAWGVRRGRRKRPGGSTPEAP
jgi:glycosyltransferase involved in cell wall biosynthesis